MENKIEIVIYKSCNSNLELKTLGYPLENNKELNKIKIEENNKRLWEKNIIIGLPVYSGLLDIFTNTFINAYIFRQQHLKTKALSIKEFIPSIFKEYIYWLNEIKRSAETDSTWDTKDHLEHILIYNNRYYKQYLNDTELKENIININPFIQFWLNCNELRIALELPLDTCFIATKESINNMENYYEFIWSQLKL